MRINALSFVPNYQNFKQNYSTNKIHFCHKENENDTIELNKNPNENRPTREIIEKNRRKEDFLAIKNGAIGALSALGLVLVISATLPETLPSYGNSIDEVAHYVDIPSEVLEVMNNAQNDDILSKVKIPELYDNLNARIEKLEKKLNDQNLSENKKEELTKEYSILKERKILQDKMGKTYRDEANSCIYLYLNDWYPLEDIEFAWNIKQGIIEKNKEISYKFEPNEENPELFSAIPYTSGVIVLKSGDFNS